MEISQKMLSRFVLLLAVSGFLITSSTAHAEHRTALLIANSKYGDKVLPTADTDAATVKTALKKLGFRTTLKENLSKSDMERAVLEFADSTPTGATSLLYFVGFGSHLFDKDGKPDNLLHSVQVTSSNLVKGRSLSVGKLCEILRQRTGARFNLIILDACYVNPHQDKKTPKGLAPPSKSEIVDDDSLLCFATKPGMVVESGRGKISPFAASLATALDESDRNTSLKAICERLKNAVAQRTDRKQIPYVFFAGESIAKRTLAPKKFRAINTPLQVGNYAGQEWTNSLGMTFCWCPPGKFQMGLSGGKNGSDARPVEVVLSKGFWISKYEYTIRDYYKARKRGAPRGSIFGHRNAPLTIINYRSAIGRATEITKKDRQAGRLPRGWEYRLPTEAEWEYACRAGTTTRFCFGDSAQTLPKYGNFADAALISDDDSFYYADPIANDGVGKRPAVVGRYLPNAWGIHDMHGNVAEWCLDRYTPKLVGGVDPVASDSGNGRRSVRGGAWCSLPEYCQSGFRNSRTESNNSGGYDYVGVRLVLKQVDR